MKFIKLTCEIQMPTDEFLGLDEVETYSVWVNIDKIVLVGEALDLESNKRYTKIETESLTTVVNETPAKVFKLIKEAERLHN